MKTSFIHVILENLFKVTFLISILSVLVFVLYPFITAILLGGILAMALSSFVNFFMIRGLSRKASVISLSLTLGLIGFIPVAMSFIRGAQMFLKLIHETKLAEKSAKISFYSQQLITHVSTVYHLDQDYIETKLQALLSFSFSFIREMLTNIVSELPYFFMMGTISILSVYFFLIESDKIKGLFEKYCYFEKKNGEKFIHMLRVSCREIFFSNIITGILQASIVSIGAFFLDVGDFFLVFFITFIVSFIPVIGAAPVAALLGISLFIDSRTGAGIGMMIIAAVAGISDNIVRPLLGSFGEVKVPPFLGFLAVIGGVIMLGIPGLFIGPLAITIIFGVLPIIIEEYLLERFD